MIPFPTRFHILVRKVASLSGSVTDHRRQDSHASALNGLSGRCLVNGSSTLFMFSFFHVFIKT